MSFAHGLRPEFTFPNGLYFINSEVIASVRNNASDVKLE